LARLGFTSFRQNDGSAGTEPYILEEDVLWLLVDDGTSRLLNLNGVFLALDRESTCEIRLVVFGESIVPDSSSGEGADSTQDVAPRRSESVNVPRPLMEELLRKGMVVRRGGARRVVRLFPEWLGLPRWLRSLRIGSSRRPSTLGFWGWSRLGLMIRCAGLGRTIRAAVEAAASEGESFAANRSLADLLSERDGLIRHAARSGWPVTCKEKAIAAFLYARANGFRPQMVLGVDLFPFRAHLWCECDGEVLSDPPEECHEFAVAAVWPSAGHQS
jgi:hypothetical protein